MAELLTLSFEGLDKVTDAYRERAERMQDLSPVFEAGDKYFRAEMDEQFRTQGAFLQGGQQWRPLNPDYAKRKHAKYGVPPAPFGILWREGRLHRGLTQEGGEHVKQITATSAVYGTTVPYGKYHQKGGPKLPQRKIIIVRDRFRAFMQRTLWAYVLRGRTGTEDQ